MKKPLVWIGGGLAAGALVWYALGTLVEWVSH